MTSVNLVEWARQSLPTSQSRTFSESPFALCISYHSAMYSVPFPALTLTVIGRKRWSRERLDEWRTVRVRGWIDLIEERVSLDLGDEEKKSLVD